MSKIESGIILLNKDSYMTSYDCIRRLKHILGIEKIGHAGTLDPFASGLLIILVGAGCKLSSYYTNQDKEYVGKIGLGKKIDTLDLTGSIKEYKDCSNINEELIDQKMIELEGNILQIPPIFSAKKVKGVRAYSLARKDVDFFLKEEEVKVFDFKRVSSLSSDYSFDFYAKVSKGTYIRSLARDLGEKLDNFGYLLQLERISTMGFNLNSSYKLSEVNESSIIPINKLFEDFPRYDIIDDFRAKLVKNGSYLNLDFNFRFIRIYFQDEFIALYENTHDNEFKPFIIL
ncbi:MAG: tRNA pseudouridine(55) synthase TruB [Acholeplasmatales bacterium]|nr:tRNA pseudouridine(55) synthase TruB [Acholeplasmatales bacterium]